MKDQILGTVHDLVADFLYYDRKNDEDLPVGSIDAAVRAGDLTQDDIVEQFRRSLHAGLAE